MASLQKISRNFPARPRRQGKASLSLNRGHRDLIIAGEIPYDCLPRGQWEQALDRAQEAGINCVACTVVWSRHEPQPGLHDFSGRNDLGEFLRLAQQRQLDAVVRIGPHAGAEFSMGGLPFWLRDIPGLDLRTRNAVYLDRVESYLRVLCQKIVPTLASRGGNVILVETEGAACPDGKLPGEGAAPYAAWLTELVRPLGIDCPVLPAHAPTEETHGFPVRTMAATDRQKYPELPLSWMEIPTVQAETDHPGRHSPDAYRLGSAILRFIATGGTALVYRPWQGGGPFGRLAACGHSAATGQEAPLNAWSEPTPKSSLLSELHHALLARKPLLSGSKPQPVSPNHDGGVFGAKWGSKTDKCAITINPDIAPHSIQMEGVKPFLQPADSACLWGMKQGSLQPIWKSWPSDRTKKGPATIPRTTWKPVEKAAPWLAFAEPRPSYRKEGIFTPQPVEQLSLTRDETDYCWYATEVQSTTARRTQLQIDHSSDFLFIFVNGRLVNQTRAPLPRKHGPGPMQAFSIPLNHGQNRIEILAYALGPVGNDERKGIGTAVRVDDRKLTGWHHYAGLIGEKLRLSHPFAHEYPLPVWRDAPQAEPLSWHLKEFELGARHLSSDWVWAFDASGLDLGTLWLNGHTLGRIGPSIPSAVSATTEAALDGFQARPLYPVCAEWLGAKNRLVFFSASGTKPDPGSLVYRPYRASVDEAGATNETA